MQKLESTAGRGSIKQSKLRELASVTNAKVVGDGSHGRPPGPVATVRRMTRQSIAEPPPLVETPQDEVARLRERVALLEDVFRCLPAGLIVTDDQQRIVACNPLADQIRGVGKRVGRSVSECHPDRSRESLDAIFERLRSAPVEKQHPIVIERSNGWQVQYARISGVDGSFRGVAWLASDIARQKRLEEQLVHQERLAGIGRMAAKLAHEVKNPLNIIAGAVHNLRSAAPQSSTDAEMVGIIEEQLHRIRGVIDHLREVTKPLEPQMRPVQVAHLIRDSVRVLGIRARLEVPDDLPEVSVDPELLQRLLVNALDNARRAVDVHGEITVSVTLETRAEGEWLVIAVEDDGPGFPGTVLDHLFQPFVTTRPDGTGLGLVIMREVCRLHCGDLAVGNRPEGGARVRARLRAR